MGNRYNPKIGSTFPCFRPSQEWSDVNFNSLVLGDLLRTVSLSTTLIIIGGITLMASLIMGFLALPIRER